MYLYIYWNGIKNKEKFNIVYVNGVTLNDTLKTSVFKLFDDIQQKPKIHLC